MDTIIFMLIGMLVGFVLKDLVKYKRTIGVLKVDDRDPDKTLYSLEIDKKIDMTSIPNMKYVIFEIDKNIISQ